jgi:hypothetical protein
LGVKMQHKIPLSGISTKYTSQNTVTKKWLTVFCTVLSSKNTTWWNFHNNVQGMLLLNHVSDNELT